MSDELADRLFHMAAAQELARRKFEGVPEETILHVLTLGREDRDKLGSPIVIKQYDSNMPIWAKYRCNCKDRVPFSTGHCQRCGHSMS